MQNAWVIGAEDAYDIRVNSPVVSRGYRRRTQWPWGWSVEDLGSTNLTNAEGRRIDGPVKVQASDQIGFGNHRVVLAARGATPQLRKVLSVSWLS